MLPADIKSQINSIWNDFWSGGISNPLEVMEQLTYLLFIKRLDELHTLAERKANRTRHGDRAADLPRRRWTPTRTAVRRPEVVRFKHLDAGRCSTLLTTTSFRSFERSAIESAYAKHMKDARLTIPTAALLRRPSTRSTRSRWQIATRRVTSTSTCCRRSPRAGQNGQFRTPRHIIQLMVEMMAPTPDRHDLRPGVRHLRLPCRSRRVHPATTTRSAHAIRSAASTSTTACSMASTSTTPCSASAR